MALVNTKKMFEMAYKNGYAVGAFNVNNMEITQGIVEAVAEEGNLLSDWVDSPVKLRGRVRVGFRMLDVQPKSAKQVDFELDPVR